MTKKIKQTTTILLAIMMVFTFMPVMGSTVINVNAAIKKPAKVIKPKVVKIGKYSAKIKWSKAKSARKYQVYLGRYIYGTRTYKKKTGRFTYGKNKKKIPSYETIKKEGYYYKYKKVKTLKKRIFTVKKLKGGELYSVKIRGINGKKKGKFSKPLKIKPKAKPVIKKVSNPQKIKKPGWYTFTNPHTGKVETVKVYLANYVNLAKYSVRGKKDGGDFFIDDTAHEWDVVKDGNSISNSEYESYPTNGDHGGNAYMTKAKKKDVVIKWTCDGTDPTPVKNDKWGHCEYTKGWVPEVPYGNPSKADQAEYDKKYKHPDGYWEYIDTYLHGITKYGKARKIFKENNTFNYDNIFWMKVYKNGKLIGEVYREK